MKPLVSNCPAGNVHTCESTKCTSCVSATSKTLDHNTHQVVIVFEFAFESKGRFPEKSCCSFGFCPKGQKGIKMANLSVFTIWDPFGPI